MEHYGLKADWQSLGEYFARLERQGIGINLASYVGATTLREVVIGGENRAPTPAELERMRSLVREAMVDGAVGVSTSLEYAPAPYAGTEELIALAAEAAPYGGIYATHMRSEGDGMLAALDETFRIAREAHIPAEIWHLKIAGKKNWGHMPEVIKRIEAARATGLDITADTYAYTAWFNDMSAFSCSCPGRTTAATEKMVQRVGRIPQRVRPHHQGHQGLRPRPGTAMIGMRSRRPESILIGVVKNPALRPLQGQTLAAIAKARGKDPIETLLDILVEDNGYTGCAVFGMQEDDVALALVQPWVSVDNDSSPAPRRKGTLLGQEHPHPRAYGTFPRILRKYVREEHRLSLEEAIRKFSALPAQRMRLADRGVLKRGLWADVVVFDPATGCRPALDVQHSERIGHGDALGAGERGAGDRRGQHDGGKAGARIARRRLHGRGGAARGLCRSSVRRSRMTCAAANA